MSFYTGAGRHEALEAICRAAMQGQAIAVIAPQGGGVTTMLGQAAVRLLDYGTIIRMDGAEMEALNTFQQALATYFEVPKEQLLTAMAEAMVFAPLMLIADSAHVISTDVLVYLAELKERFAASFTVVFGGRPRFLENLPMPAWQDTAYLTLTALTPAQSVLFIEQKQPVFLTPKEVAKLVHGGLAWPGQLVAQFTPQLGKQKQKHKVFPWWHIAAAFVLLLLLLFVWALKNQTNERVTQRVSLPAPQAQPAKPTQSVKPAPARQEKPATVGQAPQPAEAVEDSSVKTERWIAQQDGSTIMMQMMLASTEAQAQDAVAKIRHHSASYYRAQRSNKTVYVVLMGPFKQSSEGKAALQQQPIEFRERGAFPRSTRQVQEEIQR